ncbi:MAG: branched-chain amino acid ABC transporter permease [Clostridia bacterium]|nr:branched-chain amino acid ABC transporter permease [Clostridia bacterium]
MKINKKLRNALITFGIVILAFLVCEAGIEGWVDGFKLGFKDKGMLVPICCYIVLAISLNLIVGISGELSLGHAGFMSIGAFSGVVIATWLEKAVLTINDAGKTVPFFGDTAIIIITIVVAGVLAALAGVVIGIPALRLRGDYLAIVLLAFGEIIRNVFNCVLVAVDGSTMHFAIKMNESSAVGFGQGMTMVINGAQGTVNKVTSAAFSNERFIIGFILVLFTLFVVLNLINSRSGRAIMAIRDNRIAAESVGLNVMKYKMMAFVTGAALAGMAGALYGLNMKTVTPEMFDYNKSIEILVMVVLGGIGSIRGSVIAAAVLTFLPEKLRFLNDYRMLVYAVVLIVVMLATNSPILKNLWAFMLRFKPLAACVAWIQGIPAKVRGLLPGKAVPAGAATAENEQGEKGGDEQ